MKLAGIEVGVTCGKTDMMLLLPAVLFGRDGWTRRNGIWLCFLNYNIGVWIRW